MLHQRVDVRWRAPAIAGVLLLVVYFTSMAPGVTLWDAGEFIAAIHTLGIPHPPGTPLFILIGKAWTIGLGFLPTALALNALSAVSTAATGALTVLLVQRSTGRPGVAVASAFLAGTMSTAWLNATETEVYALSLLLSIAMVVVGDQAGRTGSERWVLLCAYLIALSVPLHLSALVAAPAAVLLVADREKSQGPKSRLRLAVVVPLVLVALSALAFMIIRARFDPGINQGDPATLDRWIAVVTREQYAVQGLWPRQAPFWIQIGNMLQYFDWQLALGLAPEPPLSAARGAVTIAGIALGLAGSAEHRRVDPRRWRAVAVLLLSGSVGVMLYLNLKAGPSIGWDILPDSAPHEPRERDYFFVLAFWAWAIWIAIGAASLAERLIRLRRVHDVPDPEVRSRKLAGMAALIVALVPLVLNWRAVERRSEPGASLARVAGHALLASVPERGVLFVAGDNDSYPIWYLQHVEKFRTDVAVVTIPIIPADWYRAELERRHGLRTPAKWTGLSETLAAIAADGRRQGRTIVAAVSVDPAERAALGQTRLGLRGWVWMTDSLAPIGPGPDVTYPSAVVAVNRDLSDEDRRLLIAGPDPVHPATLRYLTPAERYMLRLLACPRFRRDSAHHKSAADSLDSTCNFR